MVRIKKKKKKLSNILIFIIIIIFPFFIFINIKITPAIYKKCRFEIEKFAINKINEAVTKTINEYGYNYEDYVTIKTSEEGNILAIYTNAKQITIIHNAIIDEINKELNHTKYQHIDVALGSLTGILWFSSRGPHIPIKISYKGLTNSEILSSLKESGINQTLHKLHIKIKIKMIGFFPFHSEEVTAESDCMLSESLIVGQIPQHYTKVVSEDGSNVANNAYKYNE